MDFQNYTKEQLIAYIQKLEKNSDITYEDRMKLLILDGSPLTLSASDRDCRIKLWLCKSESLYGFSTEEAMGSDFVDLFVSKDERMQARLDQIKIIDNGEEFHNLAFDVAKSGNTLKLLTVCRRIEDPITG